MTSSPHLLFLALYSGILFHIWVWVGVGLRFTRLMITLSIAGWFDGTWRNKIGAQTISTGALEYKAHDGLTARYGVWDSGSVIL